MGTRRLITWIAGSVAVAVAAATPPAYSRPPDTFEAPRAVGTSSCLDQFLVAPDGTKFSVDESTRALSWSRPGRTRWTALPTPRFPAGATSSGSNYKGIQYAVSGPSGLVAVSRYVLDDKVHLRGFRFDPRSRTWKGTGVITSLGDNWTLSHTFKVAGNGHQYLAISANTYDGGYVYRRQLADLAPGASRWRTTRLFPTPGFSYFADLEVAPNGSAMATYNYAPDVYSDTAVGLMTHSGSGKGGWSNFKVAPIAGHFSSKPSAAIGSDGLAFATWSHGNDHQTWAAVATVGAKNKPSWSVTKIADDVGADQLATHPVADSHGGGIILMGRGTPYLISRVTRSAISTPTPLTPTGSADAYAIQDLRASNMGTPVATIERWTGSTFAEARLWRFTATPVSIPMQSLGPVWNGLEPAAMDAAGKVTSRFNVGPSGSIRCHEVSQRAVPDVVTKPWNGKFVRFTSTRPVKPGRLRCVSGFWTDAASVKTSWWRGPSRISGAAADTYTRTRKDRGKRITCRVVASNSVGVRLLKPRGT